MAMPPAGASTGISTARGAQLQKVGEASLRRWGVGPVDAISPSYRQLIGLEQQAAAIEIWHLGVVPGLLQTEDYAGHVIASYSELIEPMPPDRIDQLVRVRMARQEILERKGPVQITAVLDEAIVQRPTGGREVMLGQLTRLVELAGRTNITIRVLPHDGPHPMLAAPFNIIHVSTRGDSGDGTHSVVTSEHLNGVRLTADKDEVILHERVFRKIADTSLDVTNSAAFIRATRALRWR